ncbi:SH3 domain-containing protein [Azotobacter vinelandii]|uniref:SH3 domain-containing protein n=1 Tax=Azotobacter vinelandii TaxID=354 RepID=UPI002665A5FD|nr:SH3 domain-containing protein [Azotobacter vinelandii]WKN20243.1 SH3 domain-containing protein [Azotobacter vinelandii]
MQTSSLLTLLVAAAMAVDLQAAQPRHPHAEMLASNSAAAKGQTHGASGSGTQKTRQNERERYVSASTLNVRSAGSSGGKVLRKLKQGERVQAYETRNGWVRISPDNATPEWVVGSSLR